MLIQKFLLMCAMLSMSPLQCMEERTQPRRSLEEWLEQTIISFSQELKKLEPYREKDAAKTGEYDILHKNIQKCSVLLSELNNAETNASTSDKI